jgi:hypothetical protein
VSTESLEHPPRERFQNAIDSLSDTITLHELGYMLVQACEEVIAEGKDPTLDPAVSLIASRIGFVSPASTMSGKMWNKLIYVCKNELEATIEVKQGALQ